MLGRNRFAVAGAIGGIVVLSFATHFLLGQQSDQSDLQVASLQEQLEKGLKARRPVEFQFVARVAAQVKQGRLNQEVVLGTFSFVRKKYSDRKYLVPAFELALRKRVTQDGNRALDHVPTTLTVAQ